tara:strand:+ start:67 stop:174 length:108 start_codon:yes stop_codon:yes gene_type:complete
METKLLAMMAFGASVMTLWAWLVSNLSETQGSEKS